MRRPVVVLLLIAGLLAPSGHTDAATLSAPFIVTKSKTVKPGQDRVSLKARCPRKTEVISGGVEIGVAFAGQGAVLASAPFDSRDKGKTRDDGWLGIVNNRSASKVQMRTFAVCSRARTAIYKTGTVFSVTSGDQLGDAISCDPGTVPVGGGLTATGTSPTLELAFSAPFDGIDLDFLNDDGWRAALNNTSGISQQAVVFAICDPGTYTFEQSSTAVGSLATLSLSVPCPGGIPGAGGGAHLSGDSVHVDILSTKPLQSDPDGTFNSWRALVGNLSGGAVDLEITTICPVV
jgi:hypothetical protein